MRYWKLSHIHIKLSPFLCHNGVPRNGDNSASHQLSAGFGEDGVVVISKRSSLTSQLVRWSQFLQQDGVVCSYLTPPMPVANSGNYYGKYGHVWTGHAIWKPTSVNLISLNLWTREPFFIANQTLSNMKNNTIWYNISRNGTCLKRKRIITPNSKSYFGRIQEGFLGGKPMSSIEPNQMPKGLC